MTTMLKRAIALAASVSLGACASFGQDAGGIDGASAVVTDLARTLDASRTSQLARADALRGERRRAEVIGRLATGGALDQAMFQAALAEGPGASATVCLTSTPQASNNAMQPARHWPSG